MSHHHITIDIQPKRLNGKMGILHVIYTQKCIANCSVVPKTAYFKKNILNCRCKQNNL